MDHLLVPRDCVVFSEDETKFLCNMYPLDRRKRCKMQIVKYTVIALALFEIRTNDGKIRVRAGLIDCLVLNVKKNLWLCRSTRGLETAPPAAFRMDAVQSELVCISRSSV